MAIENGKRVKVEYTGTLDDGTVFDSSEGKAPLEFTVGEGKVIKGFDDAVKEMSLDEEKEIKIPSAEAYGDIKAELVKKVPRDQLPKEQEPQVGMILGVGMPNGQQIPARITEVADNEVTIDLNHPLAGKNLNFKLKVVGVE
ncbi:peptidylprolyl isomerase [archaeon]|jgi:FKBP-type peptidyl-prolyl cis-trans isomerase 2|nr:peptidylprolyl isomerase [archaeon]MBT6762664.1 peptidylprolyl isomerase [archaeon]